MMRSYAYCKPVPDRVTQGCQPEPVFRDPLGRRRSLGDKPGQFPNCRGRVIVASCCGIRARAIVAGVAMIIITGAAGCGGNKTPPRLLGRA